MSAAKSTNGAGGLRCACPPYALYPEFSERTTLYESDGDLAVLSSRVLHDDPPGKRLRLEPVSEDGEQFWRMRR